MTVGEVGDEVVESGRLELLFETAAFGQVVERLVVVIQGLESAFHLVEVTRFEFAALRRGVEHRVERGHVARHGLLRGDHLVEFGRQDRPSAVRHERAPLFGLLPDDDERGVQVFDLGADAQQGFRLARVAATLPESHRGAFRLAVGLRFGRLDHRVDVAFEDLRLEHVEHATQVLEHDDLT